jgi:NAD(P)-dependent dehydrogenase (short-subunit alcohol dehydrogenase family)
VKADVWDAADVRRMVAEVENQLGSVDMLMAKSQIKLIANQLGSLRETAVRTGVYGRDFRQ